LHQPLKVKITLLVLFLFEPVNLQLMLVGINISLRPGPYHYLCLPQRKSFRNFFQYEFHKHALDQNIEKNHEYFCLVGGLKI
jgi:hypothetical protein